MPPNVLRVNYTDLYLQVRDFLLTDTDPTYGLVSALGGGTASIYPRADFGDDGPTPDAAQTLTPFIVLYDGGARAMDEAGREMEVAIEVHDDLDHGIQRYPGLVLRLGLWLLGGRDAGGTKLPGFTPASDDMTRYTSRLYFKARSAALPDERYAGGTRATQLILCARAMDRSSLRGYQG